VRGLQGLSCSVQLNLSDGVRRFEDFHRHIEAGLLRREPYREPGRRARHEYRLTEPGRVSRVA
jgi:hypothetical protein